MIHLDNHSSIRTITDTAHEGVQTSARYPQLLIFQRHGGAGSSTQEVDLCSLFSSSLS